nr:ribonuclease HII [Ligilactobacillus ceti]
MKAALKNDPTPEFLERLAQDERKGAQQALTTYQKQVAKKEAAQADFLERLSYEKELWEQGFDYVAGIDEVGRGPLAGPVVTAAVILPHDFSLVEVNDSKKLNEKKREELYRKILEEAVAVAVGVADNEVIDEINIYQATRQAMNAAVNDLAIQPQHLLIDAMELDLEIPQTKLIKGDARSVSIAAASIVAKVNRDHLMTFYDDIYPGYNFKKNDGYGTKEHLAGLAQLGATPIHRKSFEPIKSHYS